MPLGRRHYAAYHSGSCGNSMVNILGIACFPKWLLFFFLINSYFIYLFILFIFGCVGSSFRARAFSSCGKWGPLLIAVRGPLTIAATPVAGHRLQMRRLSSCGSWAQLLRGMWDPPRPGLEPVSPALAGRFSTTAPPGKPQSGCFFTSPPAICKGFNFSTSSPTLVYCLSF